MRLPEQPIEYYGTKPIYRIGKLLGKPHKTDYNTATSSRGKYARVCVQNVLAKPTYTGLYDNRKKYNVVYEFIHQLCFKCGKVGHSAKLYRAHPYVNTTNSNASSHYLNIAGDNT